MRTLLLAAFVAAYTITVNAQVCKDVDNCNTCSNPGAQCWTCSKGTVLSADKKSCISCGTGCEECTADTSNKVTCVKCNKGYYLKDGACTACDTGCAECSLMTDGKTVTCDKCVTEGYAASTDATTKVTSCTACPSNCKTCSVQTDGTTKCSACFDYKGLGKQGYFLKTSDKTCGSCPSFCESCSDNGNGVGICKTCYKSYVPLEDASDSTKDGTECLSCPTDCTACSGVKLNSKATCTECAADKGLFLDSGACSVCTTGAKTCSSSSDASACKEDYRLDSTSCTACPAKCEDCPKDSNGDVTCSKCDEKYGPKLSTSKSCDSCGISNCISCSRSSSATFSCSACKLGFALVSSTSCGSCPSSCSATHGCDYSGGSYKCKTACKDASYATAPSTAGVCGLCTSADANCKTCAYTGTDLKCTACNAPYHLNATDSSCVANVDTTNQQCKTANAALTSCTACNDGYSEPSGTSCTQCTDTTNCLLCNATAVAQCKVCKDTFITSDEGLGGTCQSCSDTAWGSGNANGIANCEKCAWNAARTQIECTQCKSGYLKKSDNLACIANVDTLNAKCTALVSGSSTNCQTCDTGYGPVTSNTNCPKCNDGNCNVCGAEASGEKKCTTCKSGYITTDAAGGECKSCPSKCSACTWDSANSKTACTAGQCASGYEINPGTNACDACPENCDTCEWDSANSKMICKSNGCKTGYGRLESDKAKCNACPGSCATCSVSTATGADDTLFCDTCTGGYALNSDVCGACPSNCAECTDNKGTMECTKCVDKYALDASTKSCVKCPSNCNKCTTNAGTTKCSECKTGYSLSADSTSCTDCGTAAFSNCATCTETDSVSGKANCTACSSGYALEDGLQTKSCIDLGSLSCGTGTSGDYPAQCSVCADGFTLTKNLLCGKKCYSCGDIGAGTYVDKAKCTIPAAGANATENSAQQVDCLNGICMAVFSGGKVATGCMPKNDQFGTCTGDRAAGETCRTANNLQVCERCCTTDLCNSFVDQMDGTPDSAASITVSFLLMAASVIMALFQ